LEKAAYTLHVTADGFAPSDKTIQVPGTELNAYDVSLTT
jgi:hypothetical protein